ncbi:unannotated protein [freshwater metagenome]|uniref:Unannotated protein n=1 Tax=freshwater metagenome TaxID=449393 RepID=A0A6J7MAG1_9ZZZZ
MPQVRTAQVCTAQVRSLQVRAFEIDVLKHSVRSLETLDNRARHEKPAVYPPSLVAGVEPGRKARLHLRRTHVGAGCIRVWDTGERRLSDDLRTGSGRRQLNSQEARQDEQ